MSSAEVEAEWLALLALRQIPGLGPKLAAALVQHFGSAQAVARATVDQLTRSVPRMSAEVAGQVVSRLRSDIGARELERVCRLGLALVHRRAAEFPPLLRQVESAPLFLYARGLLRADEDRTVAIVGTRQCTPYGTRIAEEIARGLALRGYTVVSGLALGIDTAAHRSALQAGGRTVAVLAGGLGRLYPPENRPLAEAIARQGVLFSEHPVEMPALRELFPGRNRLMSGMSRAVVVVEAPERSGALITAKHAADQGRDVFVVPGRADSFASSGCLALLRQGATLVRNVEDVLESLGEPTPAERPAPPSMGNSSVPGTEPMASDTGSPSSKPPAPVPSDLSEELRRLLEAVSDEPVYVEELIEKMGQPAQQVCRNLTLLEIKGLVRRLYGNRYQRLHPG
ncbi:MAG: DNA-protecting protein DprA [Gemmataceae bacterium]